MPLVVLSAKLSLFPFCKNSGRNASGSHASMPINGLGEHAVRQSPRWIGNRQREVVESKRTNRGPMDETELPCDICTVQ